MYTYVRIYNVHKCIQQTKVNSIAENKNFIAADFYDFPTNFRNKSADMFQKVSAENSWMQYVIETNRDNTSTHLTHKSLLTIRTRHFVATNILYMFAGHNAHWSHSEWRRSNGEKKNDNRQIKTHTHSRTFSIIKSEKLPSESTIHMKYALLIRSSCTQIAQQCQRWNKCAEHGMLVRIRLSLKRLTFFEVNFFFVRFLFLSLFYTRYQGSQSYPFIFTKCLFVPKNCQTSLLHL